jgi:hypothetical protein
MAVVMRSLPSQHVSLGIASVQAIWGLLGTVPGPAIVGNMVDRTCAFKQEVRGIRQRRLARSSLLIL